MSGVEWLVAAFKDLREGPGLTPDKLADYEGGQLLELLGTPDDGAAGLQLIDQLIRKMTDRSSAWDTPDGRTRMRRKKRLISRAVRVALAVGDDDEGRPLKDYGILKERRDWACGVGAPDPKATFFFMYCDPATHRRYENDGFLILARLVTAHAENASFQEAADHELTRSNHAVPFIPIESTDVNSALTGVAQFVQEQANQTPTEAEDEPPHHECHDNDDPKAFLKDLPTFRHALKTLREALMRLEFTYIPDRLRSSDSKKTVAAWVTVGIILEALIVLAILRYTGTL